MTGPDGGAADPTMFIGALRALHALAAARGWDVSDPRKGCGGSDCGPECRNNRIEFTAVIPIFNVGPGMAVTFRARVEREAPGLPWALTPLRAYVAHATIPEMDVTPLARRDVPHGTLAEALIYQPERAARAWLAADHPRPERN